VRNRDVAVRDRRTAAEVVDEAPRAHFARGIAGAIEWQGDELVLPYALGVLDVLLHEREEPVRRRHERDVAAQLVVLIDHDLLAARAQHAPPVGEPLDVDGLASLPRDHVAAAVVDQRRSLRSRVIAIPVPDHEQRNEHRDEDHASQRSRAHGRWWCDRRDHARTMPRA